MRASFHKEMSHYEGGLDTWLHLHSPFLGLGGGGVLLVTVPAQAQHFRSNLLDHARSGQASRLVAPSNLGGGGWMQSLVTQRLMGVTRLSLPLSPPL